MLRDALVLGLPLLAWLATAYRLPALLRRPHHRALQAYWLTLCLLALALTVRLPPLYALIDARAGFPNLAYLLGDALLVGAGWAVQSFLGHLYYPDPRARGALRRGGAIFLGTLVAMTTVFVLAPVDEETSDFMRRYANVPFMPAYRLLLLVYLGSALTSVVVPAWRYARQAHGVSLRLGLRLVAVGGLVGLACVVHEVLRIAASQLGLDYPLARPDALTESLTAGTIVLTVLGSTMPAWGPRVGLSALYRRAERYRACRRLYPLWRAVCEVSPEIALVSPPSPLHDALSVRDLGFRLYRRVVEIRDGYLELRAYVEQRAVDDARELCRARRLSPEETVIVVEAASLACGLRARAQGRAARQPAVAAWEPGGLDLATEAAFLGRVADCFAHSPLVRTVVACVASERGGAGGRDAQPAR
jgi:hypothetical protein